jgi:HD-GYP domain-containing protein (c-di-GMP phosphodiesterase class II)
MASPRIQLSGRGVRLQGLNWQSEGAIRIGRHPSMDIVLDDMSVCKEHAEVRPDGFRWVVQDLAHHERHPTLLNGALLSRTDAVLHLNDVLQCGSMALEVTELEVPAPKSPPSPLPNRPSGDTRAHIRATGAFMRVQATSHHTWDQALQRVALEKNYRPQQGEHLLTLLRAGYHLAHVGSLDELLQSILVDTATTLGAQRGSIVLADPTTGTLELRTVWAPSLPAHARRCYSKSLAERSFARGESLLCRDVSGDADLLAARSVRHGAMASIICALLRSPRKRLGVMQLDRGPFQEPFEEDSFYLADAIAASVSMGIESAQLVEQQRVQFVETVTSLARAVELRDQYTGDHTHRVTDYSLLLAEELRLPGGQRYELQIGTPLHDIGKIGIDDSILRKSGPLTSAEFEIMKQHTVKGAAILGSIASMNPMIPIIRHHHERWDGSGYPDRLADDRIPITARIVAVADAFDAMTSDRPYRKALRSEEAFQEIQRQAGRHFDPACVQAFLRARHDVERLLNRPV